MAPDLPGFYFDEQKKKYFKVVNGSADQHTGKYHNSVVQSEKRKADFEKAKNAHHRGPFNKKGKTHKQEDTKFKNALLVQNRRSIDDFLQNKIDFLALKLHSNAHQYDATISAIARDLKMIWIQSDVKFSKCSRLDVYKYSPGKELVISEFGIENLESNVVSDKDFLRLIHMPCMSSVNFVNFLARLEDRLTLIERYTSCTSFVRGNHLVIRASTAYFPSSRYGTRSAVLIDVFDVRNEMAPRWSFDLTRHMKHIGYKRPHLFGFEMVANMADELDETGEGIAVQFKQPESSEHVEKTYVTSSHIVNAILFLGTNVGEIYVLNLNIDGLSDGSIHQPERNYILRLFVREVCVIRTVVESGTMFIASDVAGNICIVDESKEVDNREVYISHGSKVTNIFPFENHFIAVGLEAINVYDYQGNLIRNVEYLNNNITNQISIKFGFHEGESEFVLVNESNNELRLISLRTYRTTVLKLLDYPALGMRLKNMVVLPSKKFLKVFFEQNGNGYQKVYSI